MTTWSERRRQQNRDAQARFRRRQKDKLRNLEERETVLANQVLDLTQRSLDLPSTAVEEYLRMLERCSGWLNAYHVLHCSTETEVALQTLNSAIEAGKKLQHSTGNSLT